MDFGNREIVENRQHLEHRIAESLEFTRNR